MMLFTTFKTIQFSCKLGNQTLMTTCSLVAVALFLESTICVRTLKAWYLLDVFITNLCVFNSPTTSPSFMPFSLYTSVSSILQLNHQVCLLYTPLCHPFSILLTKYIFLMCSLHTPVSFILHLTHQVHLLVHNIPLYYPFSIYLLDVFIGIHVHFLSYIHHLTRHVYFLDKLNTIHTFVSSFFILTHQKYCLDWLNIYIYVSHPPPGT